MNLKCISLWQPWASAMAIGLKRNETRGWSTNYRGLLGIHAAKKDSAEVRAVFAELMQVEAIRAGFMRAGICCFDQLPRGQIVAVGELWACIHTGLMHDLPEVERTLGDYTPGRRAWAFRDMRALAAPIPARGAQGFFSVEVPDGLICWQ